MEKQSRDEASDHHADDEGKNQAQPNIIQIRGIGGRIMDLATPANIAIVASVAGLIAGFLASIDHKPFAVKVLFAALVLYSLAFCVYLNNHVRKSALAGERHIGEVPPVAEPSAPPAQTSGSTDAVIPVPATGTSSTGTAAQKSSGIPKSNPATETPSSLAQQPTSSGGSPMPKDSSRSITNSPIVNSTNSVQNTGDNVTINQAPPPRRLTPGQQQQIATSLSKIPKETLFRIMAFMGSDDSQTFAQDFYGAITAGGWNVTTGGVAPMPYQGVCILVKDEHNPPVKAVELGAVLKAAGIRASLIGLHGKENPEAVDLYIGRP